MKKPRTICVKCKYRKGPFFSKGHWTENFCTHPTAEPRKINPVTGELTCANDKQFPFCSNINRYGVCERYDAK